MTSFLAWTSFDRGYHGQAPRYFGQALKLAKMADDPLMGARVLTGMMRQAIHLDQLEYAAMLGRAAVHSARRGSASPRVLALMQVREARSTALRTGPDDAHGTKRIEKLLGEAEQACTRGPSDSDPHWIRKYPEAELRAEVGATRHLLAQHGRAASDAEHACREFTVSRPRSAQLNRLAAANAYLGTGEPEQAVGHAPPAVVLLPKPNMPDRAPQERRSYD